MKANFDTRKPRILVTAAAGRTGSAAVQELIERGFPTRAFVRKDDARAAQLRNMGAEVVTGNLLSMADLRRAMTDVQRAYHCPPFNQHVLHGSMLFALAAREARLEVTALMSGWNPHSAHPSLSAREHWITNNIYRALSSVDVIHVNPGLFAFPYLLGLPAIVHLGMLAIPAGSGLNAPPSNEDVGRLAAALLANPAEHIGKCYRPTGPELLSPRDIAEILTGILKRKVKYHDVPLNMFLKAARAQGFPSFELAQIRHYTEELRRGAYAVGAPTDHVKSLTGRAPENFETIARRYIAQPESIWPGLSAGSRMGAFLLAARMMLTRVPNLDQWERERGYPLLQEGVIAPESAEWRNKAEQGSLALI